MRGRGWVGDRLHALGVTLGIRYGGSFYYPSEDRQILECQILPYYQLSPQHRRIVFVGCDWYTHGYSRLFRHKWLLTMDANPANAKYSAPNHVVDYASGLEKYVEPGSVDVIFLNGVIGWGLNEVAAGEETFACFAKCLRPGGHLMVGWNDLPEHRPFDFMKLKSAQAFRPFVFEPLGRQELTVQNEWRHTYSFIEKL